MSKNILILIFLILFLNLNTFSQINKGGKPLSFLPENKQINTQIEFIKMPFVDTEKLKKEDIENNENKDLPFRYGKVIHTNIDFFKQGKSITLPSGEKITTLGLESAEAVSVDLQFNKFFLPPGSKLYIYSTDKKQILGGFSSENNKPDKTFATSMIFSDKIILEYYEPEKIKQNAEINISGLTHGYRKISKNEKGFDDSGWCNLNVACDDGKYADQIRSVCKIIFNGYTCSGALINNTNQDGTPYILTANHCYFDPAYNVFIFNYESETCENPIIEPASQSISGSVLVAKNSVSDFCLYKADNVPPSSYNVYYSGWNADNTPGISSVGIHHPSGDIKKISYDDNPPVSDYYLGTEGLENGFWRVVWDRNTTTEPGSSGSPIFDHNKRIVGQLYGGYASCSSTDEADYYGKFSVSWNYAAEPQYRLKDWLDPFNAGITQSDGYDPNVPIADIDAQVLLINSPINFYSENDTITPSAKIKNRGFLELTSFIVKYYIDSQFVESKNVVCSLASGENIDIEFNPKTFSVGNHKITVTVENPNGVEDQYTANDQLSADFKILKNIFYDNFEENNIWTLSGDFEIGKPLALGGENGFADPENAFSEQNILGNDLSGLGYFPGDYEPNLSENECSAFSPVIDCRAFTGTKLSFIRYLNLEGNLSDKALIILYTDSGTVNLWHNSEQNTEENSWNKQNFDISEYADGKKIRVKFTLGQTNNSAQFGGWNIDDFTVFGEFLPEVADTLAKKSISIYPNPSDRYFEAEIPEIPQEKCNLSIYNIFGKIIYTKEYQISELYTFQSDYESKTIIKIDAEKFLGNVFFVKINTDRNEYSEKLILLKNKK